MSLIVIYFKYCPSAEKKKKKIMHAKSDFVFFLSSGFAVKCDQDMFWCDSLTHG